MSQTQPYIPWIPLAKDFPFNSFLKMVLFPYAHLILSCEWEQVSAWERDYT